MSVISLLVKEENVRLPSPPAIAVRILEVVKREDFKFSDLGAIIQTDPALTGRILRLANSGLYPMPRQIANIDKAISILGVNALKNIALSFVLYGTFQGPKKGRFDFDLLWRRSVTAAVAGELVAAAIGFRSDEIFISTLLQDIGIAIMFICRSDDYLAAIDEKAVSGKPINAVERQIFGFDHQEVGAELLRTWQLPETVCNVIRHHHDPVMAPRELRELCKVVCASDRLAAVYYGSGSAKHVISAKEFLLKTFGMNDDESSALIDKVAERSIEIQRQFDLEPGKMRPFSVILQEANQELSRLNLSYEMLVVEHREGKRKAEQLALELQQANEKLRYFAFRDSLTGLHNFRYFQESMVRELARATRYTHSVALIMFDLDHFKSINDKYGHQIGDIVLRNIGQNIARHTRTTEIVCRYGGEEFAIVLPETNLEGAEIKAHRLREAIEGMEVRLENTVLKVTVSVGVAAHEPGHPVTRDELIDAADRAMYRAKSNGRNRVSIWKWD